MNKAGIGSLTLKMRIGKKIKSDKDTEDTEESVKETE